MNNTERERERGRKKEREREGKKRERPTLLYMTEMPQTMLCLKDMRPCYVLSLVILPT